MLQTIIMNPSDWIKAAALVTQQKQEAATTDTDQLSSMPLSQLAMDDSSPPVVHYGTAQVGHLHNPYCIRIIRLTRGHPSSRCRFSFAY